MNNRDDELPYEDNKGNYGFPPELPQNERCGFEFWCVVLFLTLLASGVVWMYGKIFGAW